jgi:hypothetical protein
VSAAGLDTRHSWLAARGRHPKGLRLAATPIFAVLALLFALGGSPMGDLLCSASSWGPVNSMALMSAFHVPAWVKRASAA